MAGTALGARLQLRPFIADQAACDGDRQAFLLALTTEHFTQQSAPVEALFPSPRGAVDEARMLSGLAG